MLKATIFICILFMGTILLLSPALTFANAPSIGQIDPPPGTKQQIAAAGANTDIAIFYFLSNMIRVATYVAGVYVMYNVVLAGYDFISAQGKADSYQKARDRVTMSVIGLLVIVLAYLLIALLSLLIFGDAGFILNPTVSGPTP